MRTMAGIVERDAIIDGSVKVDGKEVDELLFAKQATYVQQTVCVCIRILIHVYFLLTVSISIFLCMYIFLLRKRRFLKFSL